MTKLTNKKIRWIIRHKKLGDKTNEEIAISMKISKRRVQQLYSLHKRLNNMPVLNPNRRPRKELTEEEKKVIEKGYKETFLGAKLLRYHIKVHYGVNINHNRIHRHLLEIKAANEDPKKQKKRKRCRYERKHSLSLLHGDWLEWDGKQVCGFTDDASRRLLSLGEFKSATARNSIKLFKEAKRFTEEWNGWIEAVNTDRGSQFFGNKPDRKGRKGRSQFEKYLELKGIGHIPSRRNNPQTNGKFERFVYEYKKHRNKFKSPKEFMDWYNNRLHGALELEWAETPNEAFQRKLRPEVLLGLFFKNIVRED